MTEGALPKKNNFQTFTHTQCLLILFVTNAITKQLTVNMPNCKRLQDCLLT